MAWCVSSFNPQTFEAILKHPSGKTLSVTIPETHRTRVLSQVYTKNAADTYDSSLGARLRARRIEILCAVVAIETTALCALLFRGM